jgi:hypothetical protein
MGQKKLSEKDEKVYQRKNTDQKNKNQKTTKDKVDKPKKIKIMKNKKFFFGWENIKWVISELGKMYSSKPSFFSKKRIESGIAFVIAQWGMIFFLLEKHSEMSITDLVMWTGVEFAVSGYIIHQIQKEKKEEDLPPTDEDQPEIN